MGSLWKKCFGLKLKGLPHPGLFLNFLQLFLRGGGRCKVNLGHKKSPRPSGSFTYVWTG